MRPRKIDPPKRCLHCDNVVAAGWFFGLAPHLFVPLCDHHLVCPDCGAGAERLHFGSGGRDGRFEVRCGSCGYTRKSQTTFVREVSRRHGGVTP